jgi:WD40 repeat protein
LAHQPDKVEGEKVIVIGNPTGLTGSVSDGIISAFREDRSLIQITAPISPGSSGSPVMDENGQVIGVAKSGSEQGQNLNFAIAVEKVSAALGWSTAQSSASPSASGTAASIQPGVPPSPHKYFEMQLVRHFEGHNAISVGSVAFSPDGHLLGSAGQDGTLRLWDVETGNEIRRFEGGDDPCGVAFSSDGRWIACGNYNGSVKLWNVKTGNQIGEFKGHTKIVKSVAFSPDGLSIASGSDDRTIRLWDVQTGKETKRLEGHLDAVSCVTFSRDGSYIVSNGIGGTVLFWYVRTGDLTRQFGRVTDAMVRSVAFSPDGRLLVAGGTDPQGHRSQSFPRKATPGIAWLWDVETGKEIRRFEPNVDDVQSVAFSPDGRTIVSGGYWGPSSFGTSSPASRSGTLGESAMCAAWRSRRTVAG